MRTRRSLICSILAVILLLLSTSCGNLSNDEGITTTEATETTSVSADYELLYESNGDGTCDVMAIQAKPQTKKADIIIPTNSPNGERVISCNISCSSIPSIILKGTFEELSQEMYSYVDKEGFEFSEFDYKKFQSFFTLYDKNQANLKDEDREKMYENYPITKDLAVYVFAPDATISECEIIQLMISKFMSTLPDRWYAEDRLTLNSHGCYVSYYPENADITLTIEDGVTFIESCNIKNLINFTIPNSVTGIGAKAFSNCINLTSISIPDGVTSIGDSAFYNCSGLTSIVVEESNEKYHSAGNCLIETASKKLIAGCKNSVIPTNGSVTSIGGHAFYGCSSLESITIPDSVTSIGDRAFYGCSGLTSITLPFVGATKDGTSNTHFGYIFGAYSSSYSDGYVPASLKTVIITGGTSIGDDAFRGCSGLTSIVIPDSVTSIGNDAFSYCSSLTSVYYGGTAEDWAGISIDSGNTKLTNATRYYYSETQPTTTGNYWHYVDGVPTKW